MRGQMPLQVVKKYCTAATLPCRSFSVKGLLSCVVKVNGCTVPMGGMDVFVKPGITHDITIKKTTTNTPKKSIRNIRLRDIELIIRQRYYRIPAYRSCGLSVPF